MSQAQLPIAISQQLSHAIASVSRIPARIRHLTPQQQARVLRQLAQLSGACQAAVFTVTRAPGQRRPG